MKIATFAVGPRVPTGLVGAGGVVDVGARLGADAPDLMTILKSSRLDEVGGFSAAAPDLGLADIRVLKPLPRPGKIICVGVNYRGRNEEYQDAAAPQGYPSLFLRLPESFVAHQDPLIRPPESAQYDYEGEIAIVIGRRGRRIPEAEALNWIAGFTVCNEGTVRDWCKHGKFNVTAGKNFDGSGAIGPFLVTPDDVGAGPLRIVTRVNGEVRQDDTTDHMIFPMSFLIAYISTFTTLEPGDIIVTGTPTGAGVRFDPPRFLRAGDVVEVEVPGVGALANTVAEESVTPETGAPSTMQAT